MKKNNLVGFLIAFILILSSFNILLYSNCFHKKLIRNYSNDSSFFEIDRNITKYITGLSSELNVDFNEDEKSHMADVKRLVLIEEFLFITLLIWFFILVYKKKIRLNHFRKATLIMFLIAMFSLIASLFFNTFFKLFHLILFPQGNWQFNANSLMIQVYQQSFFQEFFVRIIIIAVMISLLLVILIKIIEKINHQQ